MTHPLVLRINGEVGRLGILSRRFNIPHPALRGFELIKHMKNKLQIISFVIGGIFVIKRPLEGIIRYIIPDIIKLLIVSDNMIVIFSLPNRK